MPKVVDSPLFSSDRCRVEKANKLFSKVDTPLLPYTVYIQAMGWKCDQPTRVVILFPPVIGVEFQPEERD